MIPRINSDYFLKQQKLIDACNGDLFSLRWTPNAALPRLMSKFKIPIECS
jgi:hypothetical protein